jgi:signal peptidase I
MEPTLSPGDVVIELDADRKSPKVGDIVTYIGKRIDGTSVGTFTHRVIGFDEKNNLITQGDANPSPDVQRPTIPDINGVIFLVIPFIGRLLTREALFILVPCVFGFWLVIDALKNES